ncbi:MAG: hypothetical protein GTN82_28380 [Candidatus Aminicenantes bacterium]|nr:hypothetical protein [Candidatus Aminicenantes bacterium]NIM82478.1 hypothetical protein [Candidatus Aminicenantes bacterium]NIN21853.1 hypothetical protein [Candidatus Aminicenantes bacterium]NIN45631.1 hypothetical protein [Candidatus Aminicenantes bacterium]NIR09352.1 hypothetical protein [Candidatus Aminicenantes bacterium]
MFSISKKDDKSVGSGKEAFRWPEGPAVAARAAGSPPVETYSSAVEKVCQSGGNVFSGGGNILL